MTMRQLCSGSLVVLGLTLSAMSLTGCGSSNTSEVLPTGEVKLEESKNANGEVISSAQDEYKNATPKGQQK